MRVYHFVSEEYGLDNLRKQRLRIARIDELNDPFEFVGADLSDDGFRQAVESMKTHYSKTHGILCFSESWKNPVQWAHYADKHRGLCLGFDVPDKLLFKMNYRENRLPVTEFLAEQRARGDRFVNDMNDYIGQPNSREEEEAKKGEYIEIALQRLREESEVDEKGQEFVMKILSTKFSHWSYEREHRVFASLDEETDDLYFCGFSGDLKLKEVIVGVRSRVTREEISKVLGTMIGSVDIFKVCEDFREFAMTQDKNNAF